MVRSVLQALRPRWLALVGAGAWLVACGAGTREPQSTSSPALSLTELDELERDFELSAQQLGAQLRRREVAARADVSTKAADRAGAAEAKRRREPNDQDDASPSGEERATDASTPAPEHAASGEPCELMCRALSSMQRSANGICSLVGEAHERCRRARSRLQLAERQVTQAGCACAAAP